MDQLLNSVLDQPAHMTEALWKRALFFAQSRRSPSAASRLIYAMADHGFPPDGKCYTMAISTCARRPDPDLALELLAHAEGRGVALSVHVLTAVVKALGHAGRYDDALRLHERTLEDCGDALSSHVFVAIIHAAGVAERPGEVLRLLAAMRDLGVPATKHIYNCAVSACARCGDVDSALALANAMEGDGFTPDAYTYAGLVKACIHEQRFDAAAQLARHVIRYRVHPPGAALRPAMEGLDAAGHWAECVSLFDAARRERVALDHVHWNLALCAAAQGDDLSSAQRLLHAMNEEQIYISARACSAIANAGARNSSPGPARQAIESLLSCTSTDMRPHPSCFTALAVAYRKAADLPASIDVHDLMRRHGIRPDAITYHALLQSAVQLRRTAKVKELASEAVANMRLHTQSLPQPGAGGPGAKQGGGRASAHSSSTLAPADEELANSAVLGLLQLREVASSVDALEGFASVGCLPRAETLVRLMHTAKARKRTGRDRASAFALHYRVRRLVGWVELDHLLVPQRGAAKKGGKSGPTGDTSSGDRLEEGRGTAPRDSGGRRKHIGEALRDALRAQVAARREQTSSSGEVRARGRRPPAGAAESS